MKQRIDFLTPALAVLATWIAAWTWTPFAEQPSDFLAPLAVSCVLVALTGALLRGTGLPWPTVVLCQLVVLMVWLNHQLAAEPALWDWIPTRASLKEVGTVLADAVDIAQHEASPVPANMSDFAAFPLVIGSGCALIAEFLACGVRLAPLAGLPLLAMYTAPVSQLDAGVPAYKFILGALVYVTLLWAAGSRRFWARSPMRPRLFGSGVGAALAIGIPGALVASIIAAMAPTLSRADFSSSGSGSGSGGQSVRLSDPSLNLKRDLLRGIDYPLVTALTDSGTPTYLRTSVLDLFEDGIWKPGTRQLPSSQRAEGPLPPPVGMDTNQVSSQQSTWYLATSSRFRTTWLPLPFPASEVHVDGDWRYDNSTMDVVQFDRSDRRMSLSFTATGLEPILSSEQLASAGAPSGDISRRYADTDGIPGWITDLAKQVTRTGDNAFENAVLLQRWFTQPHDNPDDPDFTYSLDRAPDGSGIEAITDFLQTSRTGYCEQFAASMTMMARTLGIPARVAVGFLSPTRATLSQEIQIWGTDLSREPGLTGWVYSSHDLHAWPELYFEGIGWVRFEPTPGSRIGARQPTYTIGVTPGQNDEETPSIPSATTSTAPVAPAPTTAAPEETAASAGSDEGSAVVSWTVVYWSLAGLVLLSGLIGPRFARARVSRRRWARAGESAAGSSQADALAAAEAAWSELRDGLVDLGVPFDRHTTVRRAAAEVASTIADDAARSALDDIVVSLERARYAAPDLVGAPHELRAEVELCLAAVRRTDTSDRWVKLWRTWMPQSLLTRAGWQVDEPLLAEPELTQI